MTSLTTSANCIKYVLFAFNFVFVITGIILLSIGLTVQGVYHGYSDFLDDQFFSAPKFLIVIGAIIFVIAFFGCCGAVRENYCMILTFSILMILVFILELAAGITGYVLRNETKSLLTHSLNQTMQLYAQPEKNMDIILLWDEVQIDFTCCGLNSAEDWVIAIASVPMSCCSPIPGATGNATCSPISQNVFKTGCVEGFGNFIKAHAVSLGAAGIALAVIQFIGIFFACYVAREVKNLHGHTGF